MIQPKSSLCGQGKLCLYMEYGPFSIMLLHPWKYNTDAWLAQDSEYFWENGMMPASQGDLEIAESIHRWHRLAIPLSKQMILWQQFPITKIIICVSVELTYCVAKSAYYIGCWDHHCKWLKGCYENLELLAVGNNIYYYSQQYFDWL